MINTNDEIIMKLLHYFITNYNYNPVILHGAKNEIWLENLDSEYKIIRLVSNYIHNDEQLNYDVLRTKQIMKSIKKKTLSWKVSTLSIFVNLGDNVHLEEESFDNITCVNVKKLEDIVLKNTVIEAFPDIKKTLSFKEEGMNLFLKLTEEINSKTEDDAKKAEDIFKPKKPIVTHILIGLNIFIFLLMYLIGDGSQNVKTLLLFGANNQELLVQYHQFYRLITSSFLHIGLFHLFINMYSLYIIGSQAESFLGKAKFLLIYLGSAIGASLLSACFLSGTVSAGASGAIFGVFGSLLYFGYHYRLYLGNMLHSQLVPTLLINLLLGFMLPGVDNGAHIGGLISGILLTMACGIKYKSKHHEKVNGIILSIIYFGFVSILLFFG